MKNPLIQRLRRRTFLMAGIALLCAALASVFVFGSSIESWWSTLRRESRRILGVDPGEVPPEEKRIREEVILKKMEEVSTQRDWRDLAPEYPQIKKVEPADEKERQRRLKDSPEMKEVQKDLMGYLMKKEDSFGPDLPVPSMKEATDLTRLKDKGTDRAFERLLSSTEKAAPEKSLEENVQIGIKGLLVSRKILERPPPPQVKVKIEAEIELTLWVLPNGTVDRVVPSVKGDADLERIAIDYLKQWRFVPLPRDQAQVEQWGTVPIKFRLR